APKPMATLDLAGADVPPPPGATTASAPQAAAPAPAEPAAEVVMEDVNEDLQKLTVIVHSFRGEQGRMPSSLEELVTKGFLPRLPAPPAGKKLVFDAKSEKVVLVNL
ncbi:MAG: hypothetical protein AB1705_05805, partial [Verrucomicrobiota bacterium]